MSDRQRHVVRRLACVAVVVAIGPGLAAGCSTAPSGSRDGGIVSLGALGGPGGTWTLGAGDALGAELFTCYLATIDTVPDAPQERYAGPAEPVPSN